MATCTARTADYDWFNFNSLVDAALLLSFVVLNCMAIFFEEFLPIFVMFDCEYLMMILLSSLSTLALLRVALTRK